MQNPISVFESFSERTVIAAFVSKQSTARSLAKGTREKKKIENQHIVTVRSCSLGDIFPRPCILSWVATFVFMAWSMRTDETAYWNISIRVKWRVYFFLWDEEVKWIIYDSISSNLSNTTKSRFPAMMAHQIEPFFILPRDVVTGPCKRRNKTFALREPSNCLFARSKTNGQNASGMVLFATRTLPVSCRSKNCWILARWHVFSQKEPKAGIPEFEWDSNIRHNHFEFSSRRFLAWL